MPYYFYVSTSYFECWRDLKVIYDVEKVREIKIVLEYIVKNSILGDYCDNSLYFLFFQN